MFTNPVALQTVEMPAAIGPVLAIATSTTYEGRRHQSWTRKLSRLEFSQIRNALRSALELQPIFGQFLPIMSENGPYSPYHNSVLGSLSTGLASKSRVSVDTLSRTFGADLCTHPLTCHNLVNFSLPSTSYFEPDGGA